jgi:predicted nucleic-acid-binding Zn-ribbon protein
MKSDDRSCRNCGSKELFSQEVGARGGYGPNLLPIGFLSSPKFHIRVCGSCGLVEWFVPKKYLGKLREKFPREA